MSPDEKTTPRGRCHHAIRHAFSEVLVEYLLKHPALVTTYPGQAEDVAHILLKVMERVLTIVDRYDLDEKEPS